MKITKSKIKKLIETVDAGLVRGVGNPIPGEMCVEAAVCFALDLPHGDNPGCVSRVVRALKIGLNDACWSSDAARAKGLRKLAVLQLGTDVNFDEVLFVRELALVIIRNTLPNALRLVGLEQEAAACESVKDLVEAKVAAAQAADRAATTQAVWVAAEAARATATATAAEAARATAATAATAETAAWSAATTARSAALMATTATATDEVLTSFAEDAANILIGMKVPGVKWLPLLKN